MKVWKLLGVAGLAGVAATGAIIVRDERARRATTPEQVRETLHQRYAASLGEPTATAPSVPRRPGWLQRRGRRRQP